MLSKTSAYFVSPKGLLDLSTGRQKEELIPQREGKFWGRRSMLQTIVFKLGMQSLAQGLEGLGIYATIYIANSTIGIKIVFLKTLITIYYYLCYIWP